MEPLMGTKPALDGTFTMSSQLADEILLRSISSTEYLHQGHLKTFWIVGPDSTQSSESNFKEGTADRMATQLSDRRSGHVNDPTLLNHPPQLLLPDQLTNNDGRTEQVTQDLCNNFTGCGRDDRPSGQTLGPTLIQLTLPGGLQQGLPPAVAADQMGSHRNIITGEYFPANGEQGSSSCMEPHCQLGLMNKEATSEEINHIDVPQGMGITVHHRSRNSDLLHTAAGRSVSSDHRIGHQEKIRYSEMMKDNELLHSPAFTFMQPYNRSFGGAAASSVPLMNHPVGNIRATAAGSASGAMKRAMSSNAPRDHIPKEKTNKLQPGSAKGSVNILKLPKDMQGRWSCERYVAAAVVCSTAQSMHEKFMMLIPL